MKSLRWGLVPYWSENASGAARLINARSETAIEKPAFRDAFRKRRCVIPADGFYEWREESDEPTLDLGFDSLPGGKTHKQPYHFRRRDGHPMALAGLWESWKDAAGKRLETFTILTTEPNRTLRDFHDRMPCILDRADVDLWLSGAETPESLMPLLRSLPDEAIRWERADVRLNNVRYEPCAL
jgi:putative SOS response-associated peptidase YedK